MGSFSLTGNLEDLAMSYYTEAEALRLEAADLEAAADDMMALLVEDEDAQEAEAEFEAYVADFASEEASVAKSRPAVIQRITVTSADGDTVVWGN